MTYKLLQLKITLTGIGKPCVWRRVVIPARATFEQLHELIQCAMGWQNCHLFQFQDNVWYYGKPKWYIIMPQFNDDESLQPDEKDARSVKLQTILKKVDCTIYYVYDFGDSWEHEIKVEKIYDSDKPTCRCLSGKGCCPPEDVGGAPGFMEMKRLFLEEPDSEEARSYREWLDVDEEDFQKHKDEYFDFNGYSVGDSNSRLRSCNFMRPGLIMELD